MFQIKEALKNKKKFETWGTFTSEGVSFDLLLEYSEKEDMNALLNRCKTVVFKKHQPVEGYDDDLFSINLAKKIKDIRDLTVGKLARLLPFDVAGMDLSAPVEYSPENAENLVLGVYGLANFLKDYITQLSNFREDLREVQEKNFETSQGSLSGSVGTLVESASEPLLTD